MVPLLRLKSASQCQQMSLSSLLPDWINLLFYLRDFLFVLPSLVVWDHGSEFVNLLLVLPVYQKEEKVSQYMCLHCIVVKTDGQIWNLLAENDLFFFYCFVLASSHDECWMCVSAVSVFEVVWLLSLFRFYGKRSFWFLDWWCFPSWSRWHPFSNSIYLTPNFLRSCSMDLPRLVGNVLAEIRLPWIFNMRNFKFWQLHWTSWQHLATTAWHLPWSEQCWEKDTFLKPTGRSFRLIGSWSWLPFAFAIIGSFKFGS